MSYRSGSQTRAAVFQRQYYVAVLNIFRFFRQPLRTLLDYLSFSRRGYPRDITIRTPTGPVVARLHSPDDLVTAVECFAKLDYPIARHTAIVVDLGSNVGISALYFLSRNPDLRVHLVEPVPRNVERLRHNLAPFQNRYQLETVAVSTVAGSAMFGCEPTGRYGALGLTTSESIEVQVRDANELLEDVLAIEGRIDALKIDVEGLELSILSHLAAPVLDRIGAIFAETPIAGPSLPGFTQRRQGGISIYHRS